MALIRKLVLAALFVGILSGVLLSLLQSLQVNTIILQAEQFEIGSGMDAETETLQTPHDHAAEQHHHDALAWQPSDGGERIFYTLISNIFAATGFSLLLMSLMSMTNNSITWLKGGAWGLAGFVTFFLAPSIGLPPEIPGTVSAALFDRQLWWMWAVMGTGGGIAVLVFAPGKIKVLGLFLVIAPQIVGVPATEVLTFANSDAQAMRELQSLAEKFYPATTLANVIYWLFMGLIASVMVKCYILPKAEAEQKPEQKQKPNNRAIAS